MKSLRAATLSIGTEITDGQIVDRNSAWISQRLIEHGLQITEHRAVPDDRDAILVALRDLSSQVDLLFVTGGLGPTSDDFTRDVIAEYFNLQLVFDETSWERIVEHLGSRGVPVRESQRQQCNFPEGSEILLNSAGTANGFTFKDKDLAVYVLPGPPAEIAAIWEAGIQHRLEGLVPETERERLFLWRCMGRGESEFADLTEQAMAGLGLRLGYRVHVPYVEVKVWVPARRLANVQPRLRALEEQLKPWLINKNDEDVADGLLAWIERPGANLKVIDAATQGFLSTRLIDRWNGRLKGVETKANPPFGFELRFETPLEPEVWIRERLASAVASSAVLVLVRGENASVWHIGIRFGASVQIHEIPPLFRQPPTAERSRRYLTEKALHLFCETLRSNQPGT